MALTVLDTPSIDPSPPVEPALSEPRTMFKILPPSPSTPAPTPTEKEPTQ